MSEIIKEDLKTLLAIVLVILLTHGLFFMIYSYCMNGDSFLALKNFYRIMYYIG